MPLKNVHPKTLEANEGHLKGGFVPAVFDGVAQFTGLYGVDGHRVTSAVMGVQPRQIETRQRRSKPKR